jgi:ribosomal protein S18 acetylase RimI-like enzyme
VEKPVKVSPLFVYPAKEGKSVFRPEVNHGPKWRPDADEKKLGPKTDQPDGIYLVTVSENTPTEWIDLTWRATIASHGQHPETMLVPGDNYDTAVAVYHRRVVGAAWARRSWRTLYLWTPSLKPDRKAYSYEELTGEAEMEGDAPKLRRDDSIEMFRATIMTMWVHKKYRRLGIGRQLVHALAKHFGLEANTIGYRLPLSKEAVGMVRSMGLSEIICGF